MPFLWSECGDLNSGPPHLAANAVSGLRRIASARKAARLRQLRSAFICRRQRRTAIPNPSCAWFGGRPESTDRPPNDKNGRGENPLPFLWSECGDLNSGPLGPEPSALPSALHPEMSFPDSFYIIRSKAANVKKIFFLPPANGKQGEKKRYLPFSRFVVYWIRQIGTNRHGGRTGPRKGYDHADTRSHRKGT